ncbi:MAG TPA: hypothetical protein VF710_15885 [Longimicrobium sp.]
MSTAETEALRNAFAERYRGVIEHLASNADMATLSRALSEVDPFSGLSIALERATTMTPPRDPLAAARARGVSAREELIRKAGGLLRVSEAARELGGVSTQAVQARRARGTILAVQVSGGEWKYPACQFTDEGPLPGLDRFLSAFRDVGPWTKLAVLLAPSARYGGKSALDLLREGELAGACSIAATYGEQG